MKKEIALSLCLVLPFLSNTTTAAVSSDDSGRTEAFLLAMNTSNPVTTKYMLQYKYAVEARCHTLLTVEQIKSTGFMNVATAMLLGEETQKRNIDTDSASTDTLQIINNNINCHDLSAPFTALLNDKPFNDKHKPLSLRLHVLNSAVSKEKK